MSEDDDGKTVFQPSKRQNRRKGDTAKEEALKRDAENNADVQKETAQEDAGKDASEKKVAEKEAVETKDVKTKKAMQFDVGDVLNNVYEIKRFIAKGGMGEVYEAVNVHNTDERVAIKVMLPEFAADERVIAMFAKEAGTLTRLHHEAIVPYRLSSRDELGRPFIVTAYVDGPSLEDQFKEFCPTEEELGDLTRRLAEGLGKAHSFGAIHRDIAPDNVLLVDGDPGLPKIIDFGIAQDARAENKGATIIGDGFAGKLNYVAPEQLGEYGRNIGPWTDLYSLALTMLAVATQKHADMGGSIASAVKKRMTVPDISAIPSRYRRAFKAALQPDPTERPQSMAAFIELMDKPAATEKASSFAPLNSEVLPAAPHETIPASKGLDISGKGKVIGVGIGAVLLISVVSAFMMTRGGTPDKGPIKGVVEVSPSAPDVELPQEIPLTVAMVEDSFSDIRCSWLALESKDSLSKFNTATDTLKVLGGASNLSSAQGGLTQTLSRAIGQAVNADLSEVAMFDSKLCDVIETLKDIKSPVPLTSSDQPSRIYEVKIHKFSDGNGGFVNAAAAKVGVEVSNIQPGKFTTILSVDPRGLIAPIANGRAQIQSFINLYGGEMNDDGFTLSIPTTSEGKKKEGYGFVVITGENEFPQTFFSDNNKDGGFPLTQGWISQFESLARTNDWTSDIFWYSVVDEVDN